MQVAHPLGFECVGDYGDEVGVLPRGQTPEEEEGEDQVLVGVCCVLFGCYAWVNGGDVGEKV